MTAESAMAKRARERAEQRKNHGGGSDMLNVPEDVSFLEIKKATMDLDILPYEVTVDNHPEVKKGDLWYQRTIFVHYSVGPRDKSVICPQTIGKRCPICDEHSKLRKDPKADDKIVDSLRAKEREIYNVIDLANEDAGVQLMVLSYYNFGKLLETELREGDPGNGAFAELVGGKTVKVRFSESKIGRTVFLEADRIDFVDREQDYAEDVLDAVVNLDELLNVRSYEEIEREFVGMPDEENKGSDGSEPPAEEQPEEQKGRRVVRRSSQRDEGGKEEPEPEEKSSPKDGEETCPACRGTGKSSRGNRCVPCEGIGTIPTDDNWDAGEKGSSEKEQEKAAPEREPKAPSRKVVRHRRR